MSSVTQEGVQYEVQDVGDSLLILTNADGATDFKVNLFKHEYDFT